MYLATFIMILQNHQVVEIKPVKCIALKQTSENAGGKNEGKFHYVIENTCRKNVSLWPFHYIDENKRVICAFPLC
jgi:hypothetical protein